MMPSLSLDAIDFIEFVEYYGRNLGLVLRSLVRSRALSFQPKADPPLAEVGPAYGWGRIFMFVVYVLKSSKNGKRYIGFSSKRAEARLKEHNSGINRFTRQNRPFHLIYTESYHSKTEAIKRERFLKSGKGREFLDGILKGP